MGVIMLNNSNGNIENLTHWLDRIFPIDTQLIDTDGIKYLVSGWYILHDQVRIKLTHVVGNQMIEGDVPFDKAMNWARFPPGDSVALYSGSSKMAQPTYP